MTLTTLMCHEVTIVRAGSTTDRYNTVVKDWSSVTRRTTRARVAQRASDEDRDGREARVTGWICYLPAGTDVTALDRIVWNDTTFEVRGAPNRAYDRHKEHHLEVDLDLVEG